MNNELGHFPSLHSETQIGENKGRLKSLCSIG